MYFVGKVKRFYAVLQRRETEHQERPTCLTWWPQVILLAERSNPCPAALVVGQSLPLSQPAGDNVDRGGGFYGCGHWRQRKPEVSYNSMVYSVL